MLLARPNGPATVYADSLLSCRREGIPSGLETEMASILHRIRVSSNSETMRFSIVSEFVGTTYRCSPGFPNWFGSITVGDTGRKVSQ